jgi:hypothetical protein
MDQKHILEKINKIHEDLRRDQFHVMTEKIQRRPFHFHRSNRGIIMRKIIHFIRRKLKNEIELILNPILDQQKDINMRFLNEIQNLKKQVYEQDQTIKGKQHGQEEKNSSDPPELNRAD